MKKAKDSKLDDALYLWFAQKRSQGIPISGPILMAKALELNEMMNQDQQFKASTGWLKNFQARHGIRQLAIQGETMSASKESVEGFKSILLEVIEEEGLTLSQIYNCDETGLFWKALPRKTLASAQEAKAPGFKVSKERVTILACSNATGDHKLRLTMIGKSKNPRCFKGLSPSAFPLWYTHQKKAWMNSDTFKQCFFHEFVPATTKYLKDRNLRVKALLILDNAPSLPSAEFLQSPDGNIKALFLPPNTTSLIQPMDQSVLENLKRRYRRELLRKLLLADTSTHETPELGVVKFWKKLNLKDTMFFAVKAWDDIPQSSLRASWNKLLSQPDSETVEEATIIPEMVQDLESIPGCGDCNEADVRDWIGLDDNDQGYQLLNDEEIKQSVTDSTSNDEAEQSVEDSIDDTRPIPSHGEVFSMLDQCLPWLENQAETTPSQVFFLKTSWIWLREKEIQF